MAPVLAGIRSGGDGGMGGLHEEFCGHGGNGWSVGIVEGMREDECYVM